MYIINSLLIINMADRRAEREYLQNDINLNGIIISNGYYGSFCQDGPSHKMQSGIDHKTTLLKTKRAFPPAKYINLRIFSLGVLFIGGVTVGCYLLYLQSIKWPIKFAFDFVSREEWDSHYLLAGRRLFSQNVVYIILQHTSTKNCANFTSCKEFLRDYQKDWEMNENIDIPFNYMIGGDGRIYEARGWSIESEHSHIRADRVISVALIGNFTETAPSKQQVNGALALLSELEYQKKVTKQYRLLGIRYKKKAHHDAEALFSIASKWKNWDEIVTIYS